MIDIGDGEFKILHKNFILSSTNQIIFLREELKKTGSIELLYRFGGRISKDILEHFKVFGDKREEMLKFWLNMVNLSGVGDLEIIELKEGLVVINCKNSPIAREYLKIGKKEKVDDLLAGMVAGFFDEWFKKSVNCREVKCMAEGERYCQFEVKTK